MVEAEDMGMPSTTFFSLSIPALLALCAGQPAVAEESGSFELVESHVHDFTRLEHAGRTSTAGPLEGTATVVKSSSGLFADGGNRRPGRLADRRPRRQVCRRHQRVSVHDELPSRPVAGLAGNLSLAKAVTGRIDLIGVSSHKIFGPVGEDRPSSGPLRDRHQG